MFLIFWNKGILRKTNKVFQKDASFFIHSLNKSFSNPFHYEVFNFNDIILV